MLCIKDGTCRMVGNELARRTAGRAFSLELVSRPRPQLLPDARSTANDTSIGGGANAAANLHAMRGQAIVSSNSKQVSSPISATSAILETRI